MLSRHALRRRVEQDSSHSAHDAPFVMSAARWLAQGLTRISKWFRNVTSDSKIRTPDNFALKKWADFRKQSGYSTDIGHKPSGKACFFQADNNKSQGREPGSPRLVRTGAGHALVLYA
jgi:hypothetical protein